MALIFIEQYEVNFNTDHGSNIEWDVLIERSYDDEDATPSWVTSPIKKLIGTGNPITVDYSRDYDIYKPIMGSKASINLVIKDDTSENAIVDFNDSSPYEFRATFSYTINSVKYKYWEGFFTQLDGSELVGTFPFDVTFTMVDGLAILEQATPPSVASLDDLNLLEVIQGALIQTGLQLPLLVDTKIQNATAEALSASTIRYDSFLKEDGTTVPYKEQVEGILSAFNAKIYQSAGNWFITNASTHGGTGDDETNTFEKYVVTSGEYVADGTETLNLRYNLSGDNETRDLIPIHEDLTLNTRRAYGSVECRPEDLTTIDIIENGKFNMDSGSTITTGWSPSTASKDQTLNAGNLTNNGSGTITTSRNERVISGSEDIWFMNSDGYASLDRTAPLEFSFDFSANGFDRSGINQTGKAELRFRLYYLFAQDLTGIGYINDEYTATKNDGTADRCFWDFTGNRWTLADGTVLGNRRTEFEGAVGIEQEDSNQFFNNSFETQALNTFWDIAEGVRPIPAGRFYIEFFYPQALNDKEKRARDNNTGIVSVYVANVQLRNMFENDDAEPVFERVQSNYTSTYEYAPLIGSGINSNYTQRTTPTVFNRTDVTESLTLEEIGTLQKLNDYRTQFKFYEGGLVNNNPVPLSPHHKVYLGYGNYPNSSLIFNGGAYSLKANMYQYTGYVPNQDTDVASDFFNMNVDLVPMPFPGISTKSVYTLAIVLNTVTDQDGNDVPGGLISSAQTGIAGEQPHFRVVGEPGEVRSYNLILEPLTGYLGNNTTTSVVDDVAFPLLPRPAYTTFGAFSNLSNTISIPLEITIPENNEFEVLYIDGGVTTRTPEVAAEVTSATVTIVHFINNCVTPQSTEFNVSGVPGSAVTFEYKLAPAIGFEAVNQFSVMSETPDVDYLTVRPSVPGSGLSPAVMEFTYVVPNTDVDAIAVVVTGGMTPDSTSSLTIVNHTLNITKTGSNLTEWNPLESDFVFRGAVGQIIPYNLPIIPTSSYSLSPTQFSINALPTGVTLAGGATITNPATQRSDEITIPLLIEILAADPLSAFQIDGNAQEEPYSLTFVVTENLPNAALQYQPADRANLRQPFDIRDVTVAGKQIAPFTIIVQSAPGFDFTSDAIDGTGDLTVEVAESQLGLEESDFSVAAALSGGNINLTISGQFPDQGEVDADPTLLGHNLIQVSIQGTAPIVPATMGIITPRTSEFTFAAATLSAVVKTDGSWNAVSNNDWITITTELGITTPDGSLEIDITEVTDSGIRIGTIDLFSSDRVTYPDALATLSITQTQSGTTASQFDTTSYEMQPDAVRGTSVYTWTDYLGGERTGSFTPAQSIADRQVCAINKPVVIDGSNGDSRTSNGDCTLPVAQGDSYADEAGTANQVATTTGGTLTFATATAAPTTASSSTITFVT